MMPKNQNDSEGADVKLLELNGVGKTVATPEGPLNILQGVSLTINQGETVAIVGSSGSGKSTLIGLMAGLDTPTEGTISFLSQEMGHLDEDARALLRLGRVGFVFQSFQLLPHLNAIENVMLPLELTNMPNPTHRAHALLESVGLSDRLHHYPNQLSGGEQQRVAIARAFSTSPQVLFADEPTGNLDTERAMIIADHLFELNEQHQTTLILVTHDPYLAKRCQRTIKLVQGKIALEEVKA